MTAARGFARRDVEVPGAGDVVLRGWWYRPDAADAAPVPGVVMAHGFSAVKEMALDRFAAVFAAAGLAVLVYDSRNPSPGRGSSAPPVMPPAGRTRSPSSSTVRRRRSSRRWQQPTGPRRCS